MIEGEVQRFLVGCALAALNLLYAREVVIRAKVPPGWVRLMLFLPCLASHVLFPANNFDPLKETMAAAVSFTNFGWWTNFKLMGLAFGRGQLVGKVGSPLMFLAAGALPIKEEGRGPKHGSGRRTRSASAAEAKVARDLSPSATLARACCRIPVLCTVIYAAPRLQVGSFALNLCYSFGLYAVLGFIFDIAGLVSSTQHHALAPLRQAFPLHVRHQLLGQALEPGRGNALKRGHLRANHRGIHDGVAVEGVKVEKPAKAINRQATRGHYRVFPRQWTGARDHHVVHVRRSRVWLGVDAFFTAQAPLCALEWFIKRQTRLRFPTPLAIVVFLTVQLTIAKFLFFPPVVRQGLDQRVINDVKRRLGLP